MSIAVEKRSIKEALKEKWQYMTGGIYMPKALLETKGELLVHISDTPLMSYAAISHLLKRLNPKWIIHTGDLVDNIKLELSFSKIDLYRKHLVKLTRMLEMSNSEVYISLGNHDHYDSIMALNTPFHICKKAETLKLGTFTIAYSHYIELLNDYEANIYLFGHNKYKKTEVNNDGKIYLNGLEQITVMDITNKQYFFLRYPIGTDDSRMLRMRIGI
ncbi:metallophosphoesterase family protein [Fusibacter ferrireducens]|uniref:Metallophosphoesterase n=1 Tax=Fusibacter ferrireducens TaxID=2785058 RepID=A0ABR9ZRQ2_9FIRM|nr:metallophosphoesterase [Fusibacter ferrireducens]MBF4693006.1 metallophosphoesterase [Fusibacter ferrireducens]